MQKRKATEVEIEDIGRVYSMFVDVKRSTQVGMALFSALKNPKNPVAN